MSFLSLLDKTCVLTQLVRTVSDDVGGTTEEKVVIASDVPCAVQEQTNTERDVRGKEQTIGTHKIYIPFGYAIDNNWTITVEGQIYDVLSVYPPRNHHTRVQVELVVP